MSRVNPLQWRPLFDAVYEMNTARDHADFVSAVLTAMSRLIPAETCQFHVVDRSTGRMLHQALPRIPFTAEEIAYYVAHPRENPTIVYYETTRDTKAKRLSDVTDIAQFRRSDYYRHCLQRLGYIHSLALPITINPHTIAGLTFESSKRNFTRRHCALLDAFGPHFRLAWQRHENPWQEKTGGTTAARQRFRALGLTAREADILYWMTEGKQNREIATILGLSLSTVQEHVANIIRKLDQENRHAATVFALRHLGRN